MDEFPEKVHIARKNWYETDCRGLSASVIKNAYERGFNRAYRLMKKPEPRVMTLKEVLALKEGTPVYVEDSGGLHGWDVFAGLAPDSNYDVMTGAPWATAEYWPQSEYNDTWRCWTGEPAIERMEEEKW